MKVAIVHYHLRPGGVTRVVENAVASLAGRGVQTVALAGEPYTGRADMCTANVPGLGYTQPNEKPDPGALWFSLKQAARAALGGEPDLWHIHNHCLGKNNAMPQVVTRLAAETPVLLQIHDFAEDGRPGNYASLSTHVPDMDTLYPQAAQVHYGLLNSRDLDFLAQSGLATQSMHLLPNPVALPDIPEDRPTVPGGEGRRLVLYPTRAIRRKNVGELLLWATLSGGDTLFATTLAPENPAVKPIHDRWVAFTNELQLPVRFALGEQVDLSFPALMAAGDAVITTSVAEGFGLAFLEPCLFGKALVGRNLPGITRDFAHVGVNLEALYDRLLVPVEWAGGLDVIRLTVAHALRAYYEAYHRPVPGNAVDVALAAMTAGDQIDFGRLSEPLQEAVIRRAQAEPGTLSGLALNYDAACAGVERNRNLVAENFDLERYGENLATVYGKVAASPVEPLRHGSHAAVLDQFLDPRRFNLLRT